LSCHIILAPETRLAESHHVTETPIILDAVSCNDTLEVQSSTQGDAQWLNG